MENKGIHSFEGGDPICPSCNHNFNHQLANNSNLENENSEGESDGGGQEGSPSTRRDLPVPLTCPLHHGTGSCLPTCPSVIGDLSMKPSNLLGMKGLFVDNLAIDCSIQRLRSIFEGYGPMECIEKTVASRSRDDEIRAFAYISYKHARCATAALACLRRQVFGSDVMLMSPGTTQRPLDMGFTGSKTQRLTPNRIFSSREARKRMSYGSECFEYRLGRRCTMGMFCQFRHIPCNQGIDRFSLVDVNMPLP